MFALADRFLIAKHQQKLNLVREVGHQWVLLVQLSDSYEYRNGLVDF